MALRAGKYASQKWASVEDQKLRAALQDQAQKLERLARDCGVELDALALPGEIKMFEDECPPGWSLFSELVDKFPRGAAEGGGGATGGGDTHSHAAGTLTATDSPTSDPTFWDGTSSPQVVAHPDHTHNITGSTADGSTLPAYHTVVYCKKDA